LLQPDPPPLAPPLAMLQWIQGCVFKSWLPMNVSVYLKISWGYSAKVASPISKLGDNVAVSVVGFSHVLIDSPLFYIYIRWWHSENLGSEKLQRLSQCCHEFNKLLSTVSKIMSIPAKNSNFVFQKCKLWSKLIVAFLTSLCSHWFMCGDSQGILFTTTGTVKVEAYDWMILCPYN